MSSARAGHGGRQVLGRRSHLVVGQVAVTDHESRLARLDLVPGEADHPNPEGARVPLHGVAVEAAVEAHDDVHPGGDSRDEVAAELGASANQVVLAWLLRGDPPVIPVPGASSVAQLDEIIAATELKLDDAQLARLAGAGALASSPSGPAGRRSRNGRPRSRASAGVKIHHSSSPTPLPTSAPSTVSLSQCAAR